MSEKTPIEQLLYLMTRLRDPETGCPWDAAQTYQTIAPFTIEEAYEVVDAIEKKDYEHLEEEVGDLLIQVVFYSQIAQEEGRFDFNEMVDKLNSKLLRRHPHVFPEGTPESQIEPGQRATVEQVAMNWKKAKEQEKTIKGACSEATNQSVLSDVPCAMPPMLRALKLQKKAAEVGFDWGTVGPVLAKVNEEVAELNEAVEQGHSKEEILGELGDVLFCCINLARHLNIDADDALRQTNRKFVNRFSRVEEILVEQKEQIHQVGLERLDECWNQAKTEERQKRKNA